MPHSLSETNQLIEVVSMSPSYEVAILLGGSALLAWVIVGLFRRPPVNLNVSVGPDAPRPGGDELGEVKQLLRQIIEQRQPEDEHDGDRRTPVYCYTVRHDGAHREPSRPVSASPVPPSDGCQDVGCRKEDGPKDDGRALGTTGASTAAMTERLRQMLDEAEAVDKPTADKPVPDKQLPETPPALEAGRQRQLDTLRRLNEAIAVDYVIPFKVGYPGAATQSPVAQVPADKEPAAQEQPAAQAGHSCSQAAGSGACVGPACAAEQPYKLLALPADEHALREGAQTCANNDNIVGCCVNPVRDCRTRQECAECLYASTQGHAAMREFVDRICPPRRTLVTLAQATAAAGELADMDAPLCAAAVDAQAVASAVPAGDGVWDAIIGLNGSVRALEEQLRQLQAKSEEVATAGGEAGGDDPRAQPEPRRDWAPPTSDEFESVALAETVARLHDAHERQLRRLQHDLQRVNLRCDLYAELLASTFASLADRCDGGRAPALQAAQPPAGTAHAHSTSARLTHMMESLGIGRGYQAADVRPLVAQPQQESPWQKQADQLLEQCGLQEELRLQAELRRVAHQMEDDLPQDDLPQDDPSQGEVDRL